MASDAVSVRLWLPRIKAAEVLADAPEELVVWDALGELHQLYLAKDRKGALEALDRFADIYGSGQIPEVSGTVEGFLAWHEQILDWHHTGRPPNGRIDRANNLHPSPAPQSPRIHQPRQPRSPRHPRHLT